MLVVFDSKTGNVKRFVSKLGMRCIQITDGLSVDEPYVLVTYTTGFGRVPPTTIRFIENNRKYLRGVSSSGNRNWASYCKAADTVSEEYFVPVISKFELSGRESDVINFTEEVSKLEVHRTEQHGHPTW